MKKILSAITLLSSLLLQTVCSAGDINAGKAVAVKYNCASCHGQDFVKGLDPSYPTLAGQHEEYLAHALRAYQRGANIPNGRDHPIMQSIAKQLNQKEINDVAAYLHQLPSPLSSRK